MPQKSFVYRAVTNLTFGRSVKVVSACDIHVLVEQEIFILLLEVSGDVSLGREFHIASRVSGEIDLVGLAPVVNEGTDVARNKSCFFSGRRFLSLSIP